MPRATRFGGKGFIEPFLKTYPHLLLVELVRYPDQAQIRESTIVAAEVAATASSAAALVASRGPNEAGERYFRETAAQTATKEI
ncbi:MAG TPA: hypothetical protein VN203_16250 [Candidatus Acidoferrum sp.]|nr:hypothetical protein [Candidatus Acidoferrum sp.]